MEQKNAPCLIATGVTCCAADTHTHTYTHTRTHTHKLFLALPCGAMYSKFAQ